MNGIADNPDLQAIRETLYENGEEYIANRHLAKLEMRIADLEAKLAARSSLSVEKQVNSLDFARQFQHSMNSFCREHKCDSTNIDQTQLMDFYTDFIIDYTKLHGTDDKTLEQVADAVNMAGRNTIGEGFTEAELPTNKDIIDSVCSSDEFIANHISDMQRIIYKDSLHLVDQLFTNMESEGNVLFERNKAALKLITHVLDNISQGNDYIRNEPAGKLFDTKAMSFSQAYDKINSSENLTTGELDAIYYTMQDTTYRLGGNMMPDEVARSDYRTDNQANIARASRDALMDLNNSLLTVLENNKEEYCFGKAREYHNQLERTQEDINLYLSVGHNKELDELLRDDDYIGAYEEFNLFHKEQKVAETDKLFMKHVTMVLGADVPKLTQVAKMVQDNSTAGKNNLAYGLELLKHTTNSEEFREAKLEIRQKNREANHLGR